MTGQERSTPSGGGARLSHRLDSPHRLESVAATVPALAATTTARSAFQSSKWIGDQPEKRRNRSIMKGLAVVPLIGWIVTVFLLPIHASY